MVVHERAVGATVEWYTPPSLFAALGLRFDLDPAAAANPTHDHVPADRKLAGWEYEDGLIEPWTGRVWLNPPYGPEAVPFIDKMVEHGNGILLVAARTETRWFQKAAASADAVCFLRDRLHFIRGTDGVQSRSSHASVLMGWGYESALAIHRADLGWTVLRGEPTWFERPEPPR